MNIETTNMGVVIGDGLNYKWLGTKLGIKNTLETEYVYTDLKGEKGDAPDTSIYPTFTALNTLLAEYTKTVDLTTALAKKAETSVTDGLTTRIGTLETAGYITKDVDNLTNYTKSADITSAITNATSGKANSSDVYLKTETYSATEVDTKIVDAQTSGKVDLTKYYTKTETDDLVSPKANTSDLTALTNRVSSNETNISTLQNAGYITKDVTNLTNYSTSSVMNTAITNAISTKANTSDVYLKTDLDPLLDKKANTTDVNTKFGDYSTTTEMNTAIANALTGHAITKIVTELPTTNIETDIFYLVPDGTTTGNSYDVYLYVNNAWERVDAVEIDLTKYSTTTEMNTAISNAIANKVNASDVYLKTEVDAIVAAKSRGNVGSDVDFFNDPMSGTLSDYYATTTGLEYTTDSSVNVLHSTVSASTILESGTSNGTYNANILTKSSTNADFTFSLYTDANNYYSISFNPTTGQYKIVQNKAGTSTTLKNVTDVNLVTTDYYNFILTIKGTSIVASIGSSVTFTATVDSTLLGGAFKIDLPTATYIKTLRVYTSTKYYIDNVLGELSSLSSTALSILG